MRNAFAFDALCYNDRRCPEQRSFHHDPIRQGAAASGGGSSASQARQLYEFAVQCRRCGDVLPAYVNLQNDLSQDYERDVWFVRKLISGSGANRCFQQIEVQLTFDANKKLIEREITGGTFVHDPVPSPDVS